MENPRVLIIDDELGVRESIRMILKDRSDVICAASGEEGLSRIEERPVDVVLLDILMPGIDGLEVLERIQDRGSAPQVIMLTATKTVKTAVRAMKLGAFDYVTKPFDVDELLLIIERAVQSAALRQEVEALRSEVGRRYSFDNVIGSGEKMQAVLRMVGMVAPLRTTVLLTGESGTGKEVIAKAIHYNSPRAEKPLVTINCAAIPENLLESELFGHERGAFTDAHARQIGHFEQAHNGTIFLDEIGEMNPGTQAKLLRVLEQGTFTRVGGSQAVKVDVRVIAATNRDLHQGMEEGTFRPDLYFRLNVVAIHLPPLRQRTEDVPLLIRHFLRTKAKDVGVAEKGFDRDALDLLTEYHWPGNVRELENVIERALVLSQNPTMGIADLPGHLSERRPGGNGRMVDVARTLPPNKSLSDVVDELEHNLILDALSRAEHNQTRAAQILGTTRRILKYKMDKLGIEGREGLGDQ
jgi:DNA-binding NtrC family response regulator